jgi:hypothetical protein
VTIVAGGRCQNKYATAGERQLPLLLLLQEHRGAAETSIIITFMQSMTALPLRRSHASMTSKRGDLLNLVKIQAIFDFKSQLLYIRSIIGRYRGTVRITT